MTNNDVTILGGGLAGLSLALQLRNKLPKARISVLEKNSHPVPEAAFKVGESTVEVAANYFAEVLGLKQHILDEQLPKLGLRFFFPSEDNRAIEQRLELGGKRFAPAASYQLDRGRFENYLADCCQAKDIEFLDEARVVDFELGRFGADHRVEFERGGETKSIRSRWLCDASGRRALLKRKLDLQKPSPHAANAVWFRVGERIKIDDWCDNQDWQQGYDDETARWYSTNHLMGKGYWVWLIPLASGSTSVGIVADETIHPLSTYNSLEKAFKWLQQHEPQCAEKLQNSGAEIQDFLAVKHYAHECKQVFSSHRWGLVGEAGFFLDPFYSPGSDFIAFGNTFLTDLVSRSLSGRPFRLQAKIYDHIFKKFYYGTAVAYQGQYQLFGNHQVMPVKVLWDYLIYWSITGFVYMHGRMCQPTMYMRHMFKLSQLGELNHFMQDFFRKWQEQLPNQTVQGEIDISQIALIRRKNQELLEDLGNRQFNRAFAENVAQIESLFWEIIDHAQLDVKVPFSRRKHAAVDKRVFQQVFEVTSPDHSLSLQSSGSGEQESHLGENAA